MRMLPVIMRETQVSVEGPQDLRVSEAGSVKLHGQQHG